MTYPQLTPEALDLMAQALRGEVIASMKITARPLEYKQTKLRVELCNDAGDPMVLLAEENVGDGCWLRICGLHEALNVAIAGR